MTREEAIEHLNTIGQYYSQDHSDPYEECERLTKDELDAIYLAIKALEQEPKTGHWIDRSEGGRIKYPWMESNECSKCGENGSAAWNYCPNCGAKMVDSQERSDKE